MNFGYAVNARSYDLLGNFDALCHTYIFSIPEHYQVNLFCQLGVFPTYDLVVVEFCKGIPVGYMLAVFVNLTLPPTSSNPAVAFGTVDQGILPWRFWARTCAGFPGVARDSSSLIFSNTSMVSATASFLTEISPKRLKATRIGKKE